MLNDDLPPNKSVHDMAARKYVGRKWIATFAPGFVVFYMAGTFVANLFSWLMTATGLVMTGLVPLDTWLFSGETLAYIITAVLQGLIFSFYLLLPYTRMGAVWPLRRRDGTVTYTILVTPVFLVGVLLSVVLSVFSITRHAYGDSFYGDLAGRINTVHLHIDRLDKKITDVYQKKIQTYDQLADQARRGEDETGIAMEGPIYRGNKQKASWAASRYADLGIRIAPADTSNNVNELWRDLVVRTAEVKRKLGVVEELNRDSQLEPIGIDAEGERAALDERTAALAPSFEGGRQVDRNLLVLNQVFNELSRPLTPKPLPFYLTLLIGIFPDLLSIGFACLTAIIVKHRGYRGIEELQNEHARLEEELSWQERINRLRTRVSAYKIFDRLWKRQGIPPEME